MEKTATNHHTSMEGDLLGLGLPALMAPVTANSSTAVADDLLVEILGNGILETTAPQSLSSVAMSSILPSTEPVDLSSETIKLANHVFLFETVLLHCWKLVVDHFTTSWLL